MFSDEHSEWDDPAFKTVEIIHAYLHTEGISNEELLIYIETEINLYKQAVTSQFSAWPQSQHLYSERSKETTSARQ